MPEPGKVTDPNVEDAQLIVGTLLTTDGNEIPFINSAGLELNDPVIFDRRSFNLNKTNEQKKFMVKMVKDKNNEENVPLEIGILLPGYNDLKKDSNNKLKWRYKKLHEDWEAAWANHKKTFQGLAHLPDNYPLFEVNPESRNAFV